MLRSLQRTLNELKEYQKHDHYLRHGNPRKHKLIQEEQILRNIIHETQMAKAQLVSPDSSVLKADEEVHV